MLDLLASKGVYATFFLAGHNVRHVHRVVHRIVDEAHAVARSRDASRSVRALARGAMARLRAGHLELKDVTGQDVRLFRPRRRIGPR